MDSKIQELFYSLISLVNFLWMELFLSAIQRKYHFTKAGLLSTWILVSFFGFWNSVISTVLNCLRKSTPFMFLPSFLNQIELVLGDFHCNSKSLLFSLVLGKWRLGSRIYFHFTILLQANNNTKNNISKAIIRGGGGSP